MIAFTCKILDSYYLMKVILWGTRGSLPGFITYKDIRKKISKAIELAMLENFNSEKEISDWIEEEVPFWVGNTYGTNTPCIEIDDPKEEGDFILCDAGTGIRNFAFKYAQSAQANKPTTFHIFMSHLHWDHIQGFPFFFPAYEKKNRIVFHGYHDQVEESIRTLMKEPFFPVPYDALEAQIEYDIKKPGENFSCAGFEIKGFEQCHPGKSYCYRFEKEGKVIVYSTDAEHKHSIIGEGYPFVDYFRGADVLIFDAMYNLADAGTSKENWGHSSNMVGIELAAMADVKNLVLFHQDPNTRDEDLDAILANTQTYREIYLEGKDGKDYPLEVYLAYDGLEIEI